MSTVMDGIRNYLPENRKQTQEKEPQVRIQFLIEISHTNVIVMTFLSFRAIKFAVCWYEQDKRGNVLSPL